METQKSERYRKVISLLDDAIKIADPGQRDQDDELIAFMIETARDEAAASLKRAIMADRERRNLPPPAND